MKNSRFLEVFIQFSDVERRKIRNLLVSPFFNTDLRIIRSYDELSLQLQNGNRILDFNKVYYVAYPNKIYKDSFLRVILSKIYKVILQYIYFQQKDNTHNIELNNSALSYFRHHHHDNLFEEYSKRQLDTLNEFSQRNDSYFELNYHFLIENYLFQVKQKREGEFNLVELSDCIDTQYFIRKLKYFCRIFNLKNKNWSELDQLGLNYISNLLKLKNKYLNNQVLCFYFLMCECYSKSYNEDSYQQALNIFLNNENLFNDDELRENYIMLLNYGIRKVNQGSDSHKDILFELYERALGRELLFENNKISRFTFRNIIEAALSVKKFDWAENFIQRYKTKLESAYQNYLSAFANSRVLSEQKKFNEALDFIANISFDDALMELACRLERIRIFVELKNYELAEYHLKSMNSYIHRKANIGYQLRYYNNFAKYLIKIINIGSNTTKLKNLRKELIDEEFITEKKWLLNLMVGK